MRTILPITVLLILAGCTTIIPIPPERSTEPHNVMLSEIASDLGWNYRWGPAAADYTMVSPQGDKVRFTIGHEIMLLNETRWRMERDAVERGNNLLLPRSVAHWLYQHVGRTDLVESTLSSNWLRKYDLEPIEAPGQKITSNRLRGLTICIDAGHGGKDPGGIGNGVQEKDVALPVALKLQELCEAAGATVIMTRTKDTYPSLDRRVAVANGARVDLFVSIHANIAPSSSEARGFEVFYNKKSAAGQKLAEAIVTAMDEATDSPNRGAKKDPRELRVLEQTTMTAVLVELGFLSNAGEARRLTQKSYQNDLAQAIFEGLAANRKAGKPVVSR